MATRRQPAELHPDFESEYRAIESTLLESERGRWFLTEYGRRSRRLDDSVLEEAIGLLQQSLREPPALLSQIGGEVQRLREEISMARATLTAMPRQNSNTGDAIQSQAIMEKVEAIHKIAWSLQANPFDPQGCETIAKNAGQLYALSQGQAIESERILSVAETLDSIANRIDSILSAILIELHAQEDQSA